MADVGVWDKVLTTQQIGQLYVRGADPTADALAFWTFDSDFSNSGTSGTTHDGYPATQSTPFTVTNAMGDSVGGGGALQLRGSTAKDYVQIGDNGSGDPVGLSLDGPMTIAAWLNPEVLGSSDGTFLGGTNRDWIRPETGGKITVRFDNHNRNTALSEGFKMDEWQHFMRARRGRQSEHLPESGVGRLAVGLHSHILPAVPRAEVSRREFRQLLPGTDGRFGIWSRVLDASEIEALYARSAPKPSSLSVLAVGGLLPGWRTHRRRQ